MGVVTVRLSGLDVLRAKLGPDLYQPAVREALTNAALFAEAEMKRRVPKDTSALARSIVSEVRPMSARVYSGLAYAVVVDQGRRPGATMPPPQALDGWAQRHGFKGSLFVLARAIGRRGIKPTHFLDATRAALEAKLPELIDVAAKKIRERWGT